MFSKNRGTSLMDIADESIIQAGRDIIWIINNLGVDNTALREIDMSRVYPAWSEYFKLYCGLTIIAYTDKFPDKRRSFVEAFTEMIRSRLKLTNANDVSPVLLNDMDEKSWITDVIIYSNKSLIEIAKVATEKIGHHIPFALTSNHKTRLHDNLSNRIALADNKLRKLNFIA